MAESGLEPGDKHLPPEVIEAFDALCRAAQTSSALAVMTVKTPISNQSHYVVAVITKDGAAAIPIAILPSGRSVAEYLKYFDVMAIKAGGPEADPDFTGVRQ